MAKISTSTNIDWVQVQEQGSDPATPAAGYGRLYCKSTGLYFVDDGGTVTGPLAASAGAGAVALISRQALGAAVATVTFAAISGSYNSLELRFTARGDTAAGAVQVNLRFNADTGANYDTQRQVGNATTNTSSENNAATSINLGNIAAASATANQAGSAVVAIPDYDNTTFRKTTIKHGGYKNFTDAAGSQIVEHTWGTWRNTAAITQIDVLCGTGNFIIGSIFTLYGIT